MPNRAAARALGLALALAVGLGAYLWTSLRVTTDAVDLLPEPDDRRLALVGRALAESALTRTQILSVGGVDLPAALTAAQHLADQWATHAEVERVQTGADPGFGEAVWQLYGSRRFGFAFDAPVPATVTDDHLREAARQLKRQLALPTAPLVKQVAPSDPLLVLPGLLRGLEALGQGGMRLHDNRFVSADATRAIVLLTTRHSALDADRQAPLLDHIAETFAALRAAHPGLTMQHAGIARFGVQARTAIEADVQRISTISALAVTVLFVLLFRSLRLLVLAQVPIVFALLAGAAATQVVFGRVHGLTLAFGATLIGVCIDYPIHYLNHHTLAPHPDGPSASLRLLWTGLWLGAATTVAGFVGLGWSSYPGIREVAVFASVGIGAALYTTRWFLPPLVPDRPRRVVLQHQWAQALERGLAALRAHRGWLWALLAAGTALALAGVPSLRWNDDLSALSAVDLALKAEDEAVRAQVAPDEPGQLVVVAAPDLETALRRNEAVAQVLAVVQRQGALGGYRSVDALVRSAATQRASLDLLRRDPGLPARLDSVFAAEGFRPGVLGPGFAQALAEAATPLSWADLEGSAAGPLVQAFRAEVDGQAALFTFLRHVRDPAAVAAAVAQVPGATFFDQRAFVNQAWAAYRTTTWSLVLFGIVAILALVAGRYRSLRQTAIASVPAVVAGFATLGVLCLAGESLNLLHLVGFVLVLSIGVDYGVYLAEIAPHPASEPATVLSIVVAALSAVLGFGLLGLSANPALRAIGLTTGLGVLASLVLAPTLLLLAAPRPRQGGMP
ncbi:MAG: MMPL family transporter [Deltaproteobacteria bacterium]|nr:MMPL family transporter [Deltaproteobacteria bacterium]